jgi:hypothetical protein
MSSDIGWYVHHHGRGHLTRMLAIAPHIDRRVRVFSSLEPPSQLPDNCAWTILDRDDTHLPDGRNPRDSDPTAGGMLHWAPLEHPGHLRRLTTIAASLDRHQVGAFVIDVSVEVTLFVRLLGVRPVVIAQPGRRNDTAHQSAYRAAEAIIAPWPQAVLEPDHLHAFSDRTVYTGGISRFDDLRPPPGSVHGDGGVVLLGGAGGASTSATEIERAEASTGIPWTILGDNPGGTWSDDPWPSLLSARVVISWAGQNAIADIAAASVAAIIVPQPRPFDEQLETAQAVRRAGLALVEPVWPAANRWPSLIERAAAMHADWAVWGVEGAARRAAATIEATARRG